MTTTPHKKHADLKKASLGNFGRNEWAILGTPCPAIKTLAAEIIRSLSSSYKCACVDAAHAKENEESLLPGRLADGAVVEYADKISHHEFAFRQSFNSFQFRKMLSDADFILVNGNH